MGELMGEFVQCQWVSVWYASGRVCTVSVSLYGMSVGEFVWYVGGSLYSVSESLYGMSVGEFVQCLWEFVWYVGGRVCTVSGRVWMEQRANFLL